MSLQTSLCLNSNISLVNEMPADELEVTGETNSLTKKLEKCVDSQLWLACMGPLVKIPELNSLIYYFPQGYVEYSQSSHMMVNPPLPLHLLCRVDSLKLMADPDTDEIFAKIGLVPTKENNSLEEEIIKNDDATVEIPESPKSFTKTLTLSDTKGGGSFTIPTQCALSVFPMLNYEAEPPVQYISCMDVHGKRWTFRHIYRGSPKRHLLTNDWSTFVKQKRLEAGDSIVFLKKDNGEIHMGIRRRQWKNRSSGLEAVKEAVRRASIGQAFEAVFDPRAGTPQYLVMAATGLRAKKIQWCPGMRVKMAVESKDESRISWVMGTVTGVEGEDLSRQLEVTWEERPGLLQKVYAWQVEPAVSSICMPLLPLSPPRKRICLQLLPASDNLPSIISTGHQSQVPVLLPLFPYEYCKYSTSSITSSPESIHGFNQDDLSSPVSTTLRLGNEFPTNTNNTPKPSFVFTDNEGCEDDVSCMLTVGPTVATPATKNRLSTEEEKISKSTSATFMRSEQTTPINAEEEEPNSRIDPNWLHL